MPIFVSPSRVDLSASGRDANVEVRIDLTDAEIYKLVELVFLPGALFSMRLAGNFLLMKIIESKVHRAKNDIEALQNDVVMRDHVSNVLFRNTNISMY